MLPWTRNARPPNMRRSASPSSPATASRIRPASPSSYAIAPVCGPARGRKGRAQRLGACHAGPRSGMIDPMVDAVDRIMALWQRLPEDDAEARRAFAEVYADRVAVNGNELTLDDLVWRARALQAALTDLRHEVVERVEQGDKLVVAFRLHGRHTGPLSTAIGALPGTGREVWVQGMDVLTFEDGRIVGITVVTDELGLLSRLDAVALRGMCRSSGIGGPTAAPCLSAWVRVRSVKRVVR